MRKHCDPVEASRPEDKTAEVVSNLRQLDEDAKRSRRVIANALASLGQMSWGS